jgi:hypothetical protein
MDQEEFNLFADSAVGELEAKQHFLHMKYRFAFSARWEFDSDAASLKLYGKDDNLNLSCNVVEIGSFSLETFTWKWG